MNPTTLFLLSALLLSAVLPSTATPDLASDLHKKKPPPPPSGIPGDFGGVPGGGYGIPGFGIPGFGNGIPGYGIPGGNGWSGGGGGGSSGPSGGRSWSGVTRPTTVCKETGPCYNKKLACPAKCFKTWSKSGKNYGGGGGGGGCTIDCKKCTAYC